MRHLLTIAGLALCLVSIGCPRSDAAEDAAAASAQPPAAGPDRPVVHLDTQGTEDWLVAKSGKARVLKLAQGDNAWFGILTLAPGAKVPVHRDATEEYLFVQSGGGTLTLDGATHELKVGSVVYMAANAEVSFANGPEQTVVLQVFAGPEPAKKYDGWKVVADSIFGFADRRSAAMDHVNALRTAEKAYHAEWDAFTSAPACPPGAPGKPGRAFTGDCSRPYAALGWSPDGDVRCTFRIEAEPGGGYNGMDDFEVFAECDLDGDGNRSLIRATRGERATLTTPQDVY